MNNTIPAIWKKALGLLRKSIRQTFATHLSCIALGIVLFAPLTGITGQFLLSFSGQSVLSDLDIAYFLVTPLGISVLTLFASLLITILVFEQASLMAIAGAAMQEKHLNFTSALSFTARRAKTIFLFALHLVIRILFLTLPFLGLGLAIAWVMISDYDINYYLAEKPPIFFIAAASIGFIVSTMAVVLFRHLLSWSLALPLILFSNSRPAHSFRQSEDLTQGNKHLVLVALGSWAGAAILLTTVVAASVQLLGSTLAPFFFNSMTLLIPALGALVTVWALGNFFVTTFTSGSFATLLLILFDRSESEIAPDAFAGSIETKKAKRAVLLLFLLLPAGVATALFVGGWLLKSIPADNDTMIIAHRGAAGKAPENTLVAMRHAIHDDADWIEIDVQETMDGEVVVIHDSDFMKLANIQLKVWEVTLEEAQNIDVGSWFHPGFSAERVPTLAQVLELAKGKCKVLIELKYYGHDQQLEQRVADIVEQAGMTKSVAVMSLKHEGIKNFRAIRPEWSVGLLSSKAIGKISDLDVDFLAINMATAKPAFIRRIRKTGKQVFVWTVNDRVSMARMMSLGVDGIITDEPALGREVLTRNSELSPIERLLLHTAVLFNQPIPQQNYRDQSP